MIDIIYYFSLYVYNLCIRFKLKSNTMSSIFLGVGTGMIANVMFVLSTADKYNVINLTLSFVYAIILLLAGSIEKRDENG